MSSPILVDCCCPFLFFPRLTPVIRMVLAPLLSATTSSAPTFRVLGTFDGIAFILFFDFLFICSLFSIFICALFCINALLFFLFCFDYFLFNL
jgi:hypothetical protein